MIERFMSSAVLQRQHKNQLELRDIDIFLENGLSSCGKCRRSLVYEYIGEHTNEEKGINLRYQLFSEAKTSILSRIHEAGFFFDYNCEYDFALVPEIKDGASVKGTIDSTLVEDGTKVGVNLHVITPQSTFFVEKEPRDWDLVPCLGAIMSGVVERVYLEYLPIDIKKLVSYRIEIDKSGALLVDGSRHKFLSRSVFIKGVTATKLSINSKTLPARDYKYKYSDQEVAKLHRKKLISDRQMNLHKSGYPVGDYQCRYCTFLDICYNI